VRETQVMHAHRIGRPSRIGVNGRLVAYAELGPTVRRSERSEGYRGHFLRRIWYVAPWDGSYSNGVGPSEAVVPSSITPGQRSKAFASQDAGPAA
jgi:hypothetical protein